MSKLSELRATLSDLHDLTMSQLITDNGTWLIFYNSAGDILFAAKAVDLRDAEGMRLTDDL